jgi:hypothetical protein
MKKLILVLVVAFLLASVLPVAACYSAAAPRPPAGPYVPMGEDPPIPPPPPPPPIK